jgi:hypothetical protein
MVGFSSGDTLALGSVAGAMSMTANSVTFSDGTIMASYDATNGVLMLSGTASVADYQAALESITYSFTPTNGDPTSGGKDTSRTIDWVVNDGVASSALATSTLTTTQTPPVVTAGAAVTFVGGSSPIVLDGTLMVDDPDDIVSATVTVSGAEAGDTLALGTVAGATSMTANSVTFNDGAVITETFSNGTLTLMTTSGAASAMDYQMALQSVSCSIAA